MAATMSDTLSDELKRWLALNLVSGCSAESIAAALVQVGVSPELAAQELTLAQQHPFVAVARDLKRKLDRRESLLKTLDALQRQDPRYLQLQRQPLPRYSDFLRDHFYAHRWGLFSGAIEHWAARDWSPATLRSRVPADTVVEVQCQRESDPNYESNSDLHRQEIAWGAFIDAVEHTTASNDFYLTANNQALSKTGLSVLLRDTANIGDGYLNLSVPGAGTHLWIGPAGVVTPLHHDLTHNLFVQVYGRKRFRLIPSLQVPYLHNEMHVFSALGLLQPRADQQAEFSRCTVIEVELGPGDMLFLPAGCWHHVTGLTASISLSFTNLQGVHNGFVEFPLG